MNEDYKYGLIYGLTDALFEISRYEEYGFEYLDEYFDNDILSFKLEYVDDDIEYKDELDFDDIFEYDEFVDLQAKIVIDKGEKLVNKMKDILNEYTFGISIVEWIWDESDYPCIFIDFKLDSDCR